MTPIRHSMQEKNDRDELIPWKWINCISEMESRRSLWLGYVRGVVAAFVFGWLAFVFWVASMVQIGSEGVGLVAVALLPAAGFAVQWVWRVSDRLLGEPSPIGYADSPWPVASTILLCLPLVAPFFLSVPSTNGAGSPRAHYVIFIAVVIGLPACRLIWLSKQVAQRGESTLASLAVYVVANVMLLALN